MSKNKGVTKWLSLLITLTMLFSAFPGVILPLPAKAEVSTFGDADELIKQDHNVFTFSDGSRNFKITFYTDDIVRIQVSSPDGVFREAKEMNWPNGSSREDIDMLVNSDKPNLGFEIPDITMTDEGDYYKLASSECVLRINKSTVMFSMYKADNSTLLWKEASVLKYGANGTVQTLESSAGEYFYGCGMQGGYFNHKGRKVLIAPDYNWDDGGASNPAPFYWSSRGYGAFRNTYDSGSYDFSDSSIVKTYHNEDRFDCFYMVGDTPQEILSHYTDLTGKPNFIPRWGLGIGYANYYEKLSQDQPPYFGDTKYADDGLESIFKMYRITDAFKDNDFPLAFVIPNDGYGSVVDNDELKIFGETILNNNGVRLGAWTSTGLKDFDTWVRNGLRMVKLDVGWVGTGYSMALDATRQAYNNIVNNSNDRAYIWSCCGWAGTQRYSAIWSGDQYGNWEYIRQTIPTYIGAGLSGNPFVGSDIDGIFSGSADTYTRDLQWKCFTPLMLNMDGWAGNRAKAPFVDDETHTEINGKYLKLRSRLMPYLYTYAAEGAQTGIPIVRAMFLEFPDDPNTYGNLVKYQFMCGENLLVAPVYTDTTVRNNIYLPEGKWIDYWSGDEYKSEGEILNGYSAPLEVLPLFVRQGAIIPMYPESLYDGEPGFNTEVTYDIYPYGYSSFTLYEDDGSSREYLEGASSSIHIASDAPEGGTGPLTVTVGQTVGTYEGQPKRRNNVLMIHTREKPTEVKLNDEVLANEKGKYEEFVSSNEAAWFYDADEKHGILYVKTGESTITDTGYTVFIPNCKTDVETEESSEPIITYNEIDRSNMTATADCYQPGYPASNVLQSIDTTNDIWDTPWGISYGASLVELPHWIEIDLGGTFDVDRIKLVPRSNSSNGTFITFKVEYRDESGQYHEIGTYNWSDWPTSRDPRNIDFDTVRATAIKITVTDSGGSGNDPSDPLYGKKTNAALADFYAYTKEITYPGEGKPEVPTGLAAEAIDNTSIKVTWNTVPGVKYYDIKIDGLIINNVTSPYTATGLESESTHEFSVRARNDSVAGDWSEAVSTTTLPDSRRFCLSPSALTATATSYQPGEEPANAVDGNESTVFHSKWYTGNVNPQWLWIKFDKSYEINGLSYLPRADAGNGTITKYEIYTSTDGGTTYTNKVAEGSWARDNTEKKVTFDPVTAQGIAIKCIESVGGFCSAREVYVYSTSLQTGRVESVEMDKPAVTIKVGDTTILKAIVLPSNAFNKNVSWSSDNPSVAVVDDNGVVSGISAGTAVITAITEDGNFTATSTVTVKEASLNKTAAALTGPDSVAPDEEFTIVYGLRNAEKVMAQDVKVSYDYEKLEFIDALPLDSNRVSILQKSVKDGTIRLIIASIGRENSINGDADLLELKFRARIPIQNTVISVLEAALSNGEGILTYAKTANKQLSAIAYNPDVNNDGRVSIGDLGIVAYYYGLDSSDTGWESARIADVNFDNKIDIFDLVIVVQKLLDMEK